MTLLVHGPAAQDPATWAWLTAWPFEPVVWLGVGVAAWGYAAASRRVRGWPAQRRRLWFAGLVVALLALAGPLATYDGSLFWVHMVQHLLLTMVAAPLLMLGAPVTLALRTSSPGARRRLTTVLHARVVRVLTHPILSWTLFAAVMWMSHFSALYNAALESELAHAGEHALYLFAGCLFWWPVVGIDPTAGRLGWGGRIAYLLLAMPQQSWLGLAIYSTDAILYPHYESLARGWGPSPLDDQRLAGTIMWVGGNLLFLVALALAALAWMRHDAREAARIDRQLDRGSNLLA